MTPHQRPLSILLALVLGSAGPSTGADVSTLLSEKLAARGSARAVVFFHDQEPPAPAGAPAEQVLRRLQRNLERSRSVSERDLSIPAAGSWLWISNSVSLGVDAKFVARAAGHPAVKRIIWDEPVELPVGAPEAPARMREEGPWTWGLKKLGVDRIRQAYKLTGAGVTLGIIDTGMDGKHPDLAGRTVAYKDFTGYSTSPADLDGHGTHVAGTMAGGAASGTAVGVAPGAKLVVARAVTGVDPLTHVLHALQWMADPDGDPSTPDAPRAVNMSWHIKGDQQAYYEALTALSACGVLPVAAAGNRGATGIQAPHAFPETLTIGGTYDDDRIPTWSAIGPVDYQGQSQKKPEVVAPGGSIYSCQLEGQYGYSSGTSMASPHIAGLVALMLEADPDLKPADLRKILVETAVDLGTPGWNRDSGFGRVDGFAAVRRAVQGAAAREPRAPREASQCETFDVLHGASVPPAPSARGASSSDPDRWIVLFREPARSRRASGARSVLEELRSDLDLARVRATAWPGATPGVTVLSWNWISRSATVAVSDRLALGALARDPEVQAIVPDRAVPLPGRGDVSVPRTAEGPFTWGLVKLGVPALRERYGLTGKGVRVGVIDTGVDASHPDLAGRIALWRDFVAPGSGPTDSLGHGTHVCGTIAGGSTTGTSIGVAPAASLVVCRALGPGSTTTHLLSAMEWMLDPDGDAATDDAPRVVNMSWRAGGDETDMLPMYRAMESMVRAGVIPSRSAGNESTLGISHPSEFPGCLASGSTNRNDWISPFSAHGPATYQGQPVRKPDWVAPGSAVLSAEPGGGHGTRSGTSMAAAHVSGVLALLLEAAPGMSQERAREILTATAMDMAAPGWDATSGAGRLDALGAVALAIGGSAPSR